MIDIRADTGTMIYMKSITTAGATMHKAHEIEMHRRNQHNFATTGNQWAMHDYANILFAAGKVNEDTLMPGFWYQDLAYSADLFEQFLSTGRVAGIGF